MFLVGSSLRNLFRLLFTNHFYIHWKYIPRFLAIVFLVVILTPLRVIEKMFIFRKIRKLEIRNDPIFILGYWRSGTTFLHELLLQDKKFTYLTFPESLMPWIFLLFSNFLNYVFSKILPERRPHDNVKMDVTSPSEHEFCFLNMSSFSPITCFFFPKKFNYYRRYVNFDNVPNNQKKKWKKDFLYLFKKILLKNPDRVLLVKNPLDSARINMILEIFPNSKFIHIYRNPYEVFFSAQRMFGYFLNVFPLQRPTFDFDGFLFESYQIIYQRYLESIKLIPEGNLVDLSYEDLVQDPIKELERIYYNLSIPGFGDNKKHFGKYLKSVEDHEVHQYTFTKKDKLKIYSELKLTIDKYGYEKPE